MIVAFRDVVVDFGSRRMERSGTSVHLSPKAFDLLQRLVERRPNVVRTADLHAALWPNVHVGGTSLPALVAELRSALGEAPGDGSSIKTFPRVGYAFVAETAPGTTSTAGPCAWLLIERRWVAVGEGTSVLGRDGSDVIEVAAPTVSRRHARLHVSAGEVIVDDLDSKNGTWVRGQRVTAPTRLSDGEEFQLGSVQIRVSFDKPGTTTETVATDARP